MNFRFHPLALEEFEKSALYYEERQIGLGERFILSIESAIQVVSANPLAAPNCPLLQALCALSGQVPTMEYDFQMNSNLRQLPVEERIRLVEDLWDSIAQDQHALRLTSEQVAELDRRLDAFESDGDTGRPATGAISEIRKRL